MMPGSVDRKGAGREARSQEKKQAEIIRRAGTEIVKATLRLAVGLSTGDVQTNCANNVAVHLAEQAKKEGWYEPGSRMAKQVDQLIDRGRKTLKK